MRQNVVPQDYRRHFPPEMKDHHSHDILPTCPRCHGLANLYDDQLKKELAIKYNAPLVMLIYYTNWSALYGFPPLRKTVSPLVKNYDTITCVKIANQMLRDSL